MIHYPTTYSHGRKADLSTLPDLADTVLVLWLSSQDITYFNDQTAEWMTVVKQAKASLILFAEDVPLSYDLRPVGMTDADIKHTSDVYDMPTGDQVVRMAEFLQRHADDKVHFACSAGVSRSGFGHFFLDVMNDRLDDVYADTTTDIVRINGEPYTGKLDISSRVKHYMPNTEYIRLAIELGYIDPATINALPSRPAVKQTLTF